MLGTLRLLYNQFCFLRVRLKSQNYFNSVTVVSLLFLALGSGTIYYSILLYAQSINQSINQSVSQSVCLSVCRSVCLSVCRSVGRSVRPSVCLSVCLSIYLKGVFSRTKTISEKDENKTRFAISNP